MNPLRKCQTLSLAAILGLTFCITKVLDCILELSIPKRADRELKDRLDELVMFRRLAIGLKHETIELKKEIYGLLKGIEYAEKY